MWDYGTMGDNTKQYQMLPKNTKWLLTIQGDTKQSQMIQQYQMIPNNTGWYQTIPDDTKQYLMIPNNTISYQGIFDKKDINSLLSLHLVPFAF